MLFVGRVLNVPDKTAVRTLGFPAVSCSWKVPVPLMLVPISAGGGRARGCYRKIDEHDLGGGGGGNPLARPAEEAKRERGGEELFFSVS